MNEDYDAKLELIRQELHELKALLQARDGLPFVLSLEAAALHLGDISLPTLRRMIKAGLVRTVPINKREMVPASEVRRIGTPEARASTVQPMKKKQRAATANGEAAKIRAALKKR